MNYNGIQTTSGKGKKKRSDSQLIHLLHLCSLYEIPESDFNLIHCKNDATQVIITLNSNWHFINFRWREGEEEETGDL